MRAPQVKKEPSGGTRRQSITIEKRTAEEGTRTPKDLSRLGTFPAAIPVQSASFAVNGRNGGGCELQLIGQQLDFALVTLIPDRHQA